MSQFVNHSSCQVRLLAVSRMFVNHLLRRIYSRFYPAVFMRSPLWVNALSSLVSCSEPMFVNHLLRRFIFEFSDAFLSFGWSAVSRIIRRYLCVLLCWVNALSSLASCSEPHVRQSLAPADLFSVYSAVFMRSPLLSQRFVKSWFLAVNQLFVNHLLRRFYLRVFRCLLPFGRSAVSRVLRRYLCVLLCWVNALSSLVSCSEPIVRQSLAPTVLSSSFSDAFLPFGRSAVLGFSGGIYAFSLLSQRFVKFGFLQWAIGSSITCSDEISFSIFSGDFVLFLLSILSIRFIRCRSISQSRSFSFEFPRMWFPCFRFYFGFAIV